MPNPRAKIVRGQSRSVVCPKNKGGDQLFEKHGAWPADRGVREYKGENMTGNKGKNYFL